jgi:methylenetetrahydrofolate reductase (NADPH)
MARVGDLGLLERVSILVSVYVPRSTRALRFLRDVVPGIDVPDEVMQRLAGAAPGEQAKEGFRLALEIVAALRETPGVSGVHLISIGGQEAILRLIEEAGLRREGESAVSGP